MTTPDPQPSYNDSPAIEVWKLRRAISPVAKVLHTRASEAVTANGNTVDINTGGAQRLAIDVNITAATGTSPTLDLIVETRGTDGVYYELTRVAGITAPRQVIWSVGPGLAVNHLFGELIRLRWVLGGVTPSFTFSASVVGR